MGRDSGEVFQLSLRIRAIFSRAIWNIEKDATEKEDIGIKAWEKDSYLLWIRQSKIRDSLGDL